MSRKQYNEYPTNTSNGRSLGHTIPNGIRHRVYAFYDNKDFVCFNFKETAESVNKTYFCLHDKNTGKTIYTERNIAFDNLFGLPSQLNVVGFWRNHLVIVIDSFLILNNYKSIKELFAANKPEYLPQLEMMKRSISIDSNPVLILLSL